MQTKNNSRSFYMVVLTLAIPIMLQNGITNLVSLLDNIMVGRLCTESMSGVSITNQLLFVFNLAIFGVASGAGIFTAQFHGSNDQEGIRHTLRYKLVLCTAVTAIAMVLLWFWGGNFIQMFLYESDQQGDLALTLSEGQWYLRTMMWGLIPYAITQAYASTLRETGESMLPLKAGLVAVCVNIVINYILIFGKFGMPALGVMGAAIGTSISRVVECGIVVVVASRKTDRFPYLKHLFSKFTLPNKALLYGLTSRALSLMVNEMVWAFATTMLAQSYATRGLAVVAAFNIHTTIYNVLATAFLALGTAAGIVIGNRLGADDKKGALLANRQLSRFAVVFSLIFVALLMIAAQFFPMAFDTTDHVRQLATQFMMVGALMMPLQAYLHIAYFTLRSGGCTGVTFIFDCVFICCISVPLAFFLSRYTELGAVYLYLIVEGTNILKAFVGYILIRKEIWLRNIVG